MLSLWKCVNKFFYMLPWFISSSDEEEQKKESSDNKKENRKSTDKIKIGTRYNSSDTRAQGDYTLFYTGYAAGQLYKDGGSVTEPAIGIAGAEGDSSTSEVVLSDTLEKAYLMQGARPKERDELRNLHISTQQRNVYNVEECTTLPGVQEHNMSYNNWDLYSARQDPASGYSNLFQGDLSTQLEELSIAEFVNPKRDVESFEECTTLLGVHGHNMSYNNWDLYSALQDTASGYSSLFQGDLSTQLEELSSAGFVKPKRDVESFEECTTLLGVHGYNRSHNSWDLYSARQDTASEYSSLFQEDLSTQLEKLNITKLTNIISNKRLLSDIHSSSIRRVKHAHVGYVGQLMQSMFCCIQGSNYEMKPYVKQRLSRITCDIDFFIGLLKVELVAQLALALGYKELSCALMCYSCGYLDACAFNVMFNKIMDVMVTNSRTSVLLGPLHDLFVCYTDTSVIDSEVLCRNKPQQYLKLVMVLAELVFARNNKLCDGETVFM